MDTDYKCFLKLILATWFAEKLDDIFSFAYHSRLLATDQHTSTNEIFR